MHEVPMAGSKPHFYYLIYKPYGVLSQFTDRRGRRTLAELGKFPSDVYPVGRLDMDSEGLILLTNDSEVNYRLAEPKFSHPRTYLVQVEGIPSHTDLERLRTGVTIEGRLTKPARVRLLEQHPEMPPRTPAVRERKTIPTAWIEIVLREGRNRQVRKMTASVGHPTLRLVRTAIGEFTIGSLEPGQSRRLSDSEVRLLRTDVGLEP